MEKKSHGVYAEKELKYMLLFQKLKEVVFMPIIKVLSSMWITANQVSIAWWIIALIWTLLSIYLWDITWWVLWIWLHFILDWFDWTLARYQNKMNKAWSFIDVVFDHLWIVSSCILMLSFWIASSINVLLYWVLYTIVIFYAYILWEINKPFWLILRPRLFLYIMLLLIVVFGLDSYYLELLIYLCNGIMFIQIVLWTKSLYAYIKNDENS